MHLRAVAWLLEHTLVPHEVPFATAPQAPVEQLWQVPVQAPSQQTLPTQKPLAQAVLEPQGWPFASAWPQRLFWQVAPGAQSPFCVQLVLHAPALQAYGAHDWGDWPHAPAPSQRGTESVDASLQVANPQLIEVAGNPQLPAPLQTPPQVPLPAHSLSGSMLVRPAQVPRFEV